MRHQELIDPVFIQLHILPRGQLAAFHVCNIVSIYLIDFIRAKLDFTRILRFFCFLFL